MRQLVWSHAAAKEFDDLGAETQESILGGLLDLLAHGRGDVTRLHGRLQGMHRLRVGRYRVRFTIEGADDFLVVRVRKRDEAYRD